MDCTRETKSQGERSGKQYRSGRQQELNKAAQVRYRCGGTLSGSYLAAP